MSEDKSGSPLCGIYIRIDDFADMIKVITDVRQMAMAINRGSGYEKNMCVVELAYSAEDDEKIADLVSLIQAEGLVAIISGISNFEDIKQADGVLLEDLSLFGMAREALGEDAIIGIVCGAERSKASKAVELEADYVTLQADPSLISWFSAQSEIMIVAAGKGITNDNCGDLVRFGAEFVDVRDYIFANEKGVMQGTVNIMYAIDLAAYRPKQIN